MSSGGSLESESPDVADDGGDPELCGRVADARPRPDPILVAVVRANAEAALFGARPPVSVGRYELLREVGTGGGGSVFVARDPELERDVAMKLIAAPDPALRARALAEGQALARLSHPNIVPIFDVGAVEDRVYLVMELIKGDSLRAYADRASVRDVVRAYRQAGEGLVAVHGIGLVHGDFKPENAMIGADGRVRVVDFGLASAEGAAGFGGTPRYMSPELRSGQAATPAADQYAFATALGEGAARARGGPLPRWLEPIVKRGTAEDPSTRYPSLAALLRAVANDPRTRWRRRALVATPIAVAALGFAIGRGGEAGVAPCDGGAATLAPAWTAERAGAAADHIARFATEFAVDSARRARTAIDAYARRWIAGHEAACVAARTEPSPMVVDRRATCLTGARNQLGATIDVLAAVELGGLPAAMQAVAELPDLERCENPTALANDIPPPPPRQHARVGEIRAAIDRAFVRSTAAQPDANELATAAVAEARALGYRPLLARALLVRGRALDLLGDRPASLAPLTEALQLAIPVRDDATAVEAYARLVRARAPEHYGADLWGMIPILGLAERLGAGDRFAIALLHNNVGVKARAAGELDRARAELTRAIGIARQVTGPGTVELSWTRANLAAILENGAEREKLMTEAVVVARGQLGDDHPLALRLAMQAAFGSVDGARARAALRRPCTRLALLHPELSAAVVECGYELGLLDFASDDHASARVSFGLVLAARSGPDVDRDRAESARAFARLLDGDRPGAARAFDELARRIRPTPATEWYRLPVPADVELARAELFRSTQDRDGERTAIDRSIHYLERAASVSPVLLVKRRLEWARRQRHAR